MSGIEKPKRKFWQFRLLTAVAMMTVAAAMLILNTRKLETAQLFDHGNGYSSIEDQYGWPFAVYRTIPDWIAALNLAEYNSSKSKTDLPPLSRRPDIDKLIYKNIVLNALVGLCLLLVVQFACEWLIRRREGRKP
jgi:hypothetical protein